MKIKSENERGLKLMLSDVFSRWGNCLLAAFLFLSLSSPCDAAFQDPYWSARVAALGGAFTAMSDDATGIFYNPAATVKVKGRQFNFTYAKLFAGLDEVRLSLSQLAYVQPLKDGGVFGIGWGNFSADFYREDMVVTSYAYDLTKFFQGYEGKLSAGVSAKYLTRRFVLDDRTANDPVFSDGNRTHNASFDLHLFSVPEPDIFPGLSLGLSIRSLNQPDVGFRERERLPSEVVGGLYYRWRELSIPLDLSYRAGEVRPRVGLERYWFEDRLALRLGSDLTQIGSGFGYEQALSGKFSLVVDYAFLWPLGVRGSVGSHRLTVGLKF